MLMKNKNFLEGFIVFSVMTGVLLPVRLFFVTHISTDWFGSFGIISAISVLMIILTKKGKLGRFGKMFERQMNKLQFQDWIYGIVGMFLAIFFAFPQLSAVLAVLNDSLNGWILHFYTVAFVEYLELFGILIFFRISLSKKNSLQPSIDKKPESEIV